MIAAQFTKVASVITPTEGAIFVHSLNRAVAPPGDRALGWQRR